MTTLPIPGGPTNREIIDEAWLGIGVSDNMFGRTPEEYASSGKRLRAMMGEWPFDQLGYIREDDPGLRLEEESGIEQKWLSAVASSLAERIAASIGKSLSPEARRVKVINYSRLCSAVGAPAAVEFGDATPMGAGQRRNSYASTYFPASTE